MLELTIRPPMSAEHVEMRRKTIGGSSAPVVLGVSKFKTQRQLYDEMTGESPPMQEETPDMRRGRMLEPIALSLIAEDRCCRVNPFPQDEPMRGRTYPFAHATPDAIVYDPGTDAAGVTTYRSLYLEIKCPRPHTFRRVYMDGPTPDYMVQVQHGMAVFGAKEWVLFVLDAITMSGVWIEVPRDDKFIADMMEREADFFARVQSRTPPPDDPLIAPDVPKMEGAMTYLTDKAAIRAAQTFLEMKALEDEAKELVAEAKGRLIAASGEVEAFEVRDGESPILRGYNRVMPGVKTFDHKACVKKYPDMDSYYKQGNPYQKFTPYDLRGRGGKL